MSIKEVGEGERREDYLSLILGLILNIKGKLGKMK
jgi:hypothetical protein